MKKALYGILGVLVVAFVATWLYLQWAHATFVDRSIRAYTGIDTYTISGKEHSAYDWYASLRISENDGTKLLQKYPFRQGFSKAVLVRKLANPYVNDCPSCWYYLDDKGRGPYDYRLFILSGDKERLTVYELFGN
ncbi:hypothetical protein [Acidicapsa ligni]|uniref:hypothetical protein n=1 Tax=Acidicapsa ligni TaxID=542300 RepID=UPI0021E0E458|nr:hypothetical protein [Acidicapsa ligni]